MSDGDIFPELTNDLIIRAAFGEKVERVPVWIMRQAGRYLPEFKGVREKHGFFEICQTPELSCEITLQPINRFSLDASIIFSDILVVPQAVGQIVEMLPGKGPSFPNPITTVEEMKALDWNVDVGEKLKYVYQAITLTRKELKGRCPLIGFSGAPWTLMSYMIEGCGSKTISNAKKWLYTNNTASHDFLGKLTDIICQYLLHQVKAGAQLLQVFESHAGILTPDQFSEFSLKYLKKICNFLRTEIPKLNLPRQIPLIVFAKDAHFALKDLSESGYDVVSLDWTIKPELARESMGTVTLQGNLDPPALYCSENDLVAETRKMLERFGCQRYIANLGHGIYPDMNPDRVELFVNSVHSISEQIIAGDKEKA